MFQKQYFELTKLGGHKQSLGGGTAPLAPRSDGTVLMPLNLISHLFRAIWKH